MISQRTDSTWLNHFYNIGPGDGSELFFERQKSAYREQPLNYTQSVNVIM